ncbi:hypothetical protein CDL12_27863 [Handroanthus impetiginosus]|uniref:Uncharacterized protein n=1 Tax=Handroanthus impetiginosus TaxID=429701 RepID=A0A2G9G2W8_9LAMI|nr:hypothetical protein CDL12_27863 [Handroanthus impetiginosus]
MLRGLALYDAPRVATRDFSFHWKMSDIKLDEEKIFSVHDDREDNFMGDNDCLYIDYSDRDNGSDSREYVSNDDNMDTVISFLFKSIDKAQSFYIAYGREIGFGVRKQACKNEMPKCNTSSFRVSHDMFSNMYKVARFVRDHNHHHEPMMQIVVRDVIAPSNKTSLTLLTKIGMRPCNVLRFMEHLMGGTGKLSFNWKDAYNYLYKQCQEMISNGDVNTTICHLEDMRSHFQGMIYKYIIDDEGVLIKLFWCDEMSRAEFNMFGDVLMFDNTYKANKYKFTLVMISGVNN